MNLEMTFHVFAGDDYYPNGGALDHLSSHESVADATTALMAYRWAETYENSTGWAHITTSEMEVLHRFRFSRGNWERVSA